MPFVPRPHIPLPTTPGLGTTVTVPPPVLHRVAPVTVPQTTIPNVSRTTYRDVSLEITDTQEGRIAPICYGRVRFAPKLTHFDIVSQQIEMILLVGEGEIDGFEAVYVDGNEVYAAPKAWATVQVRTGSLTQTAVTCISNVTVASMTHPGQAYVALKLALGTAPLNGGIPQVEVVIRGLKVWDWRSMDLVPPAWSENPVLHLYDALASTDYGAAVAPSYSGDCDLKNTPPLGTFATSANACDVVTAYDSAGYFTGQQQSDVQDDCSVAHHMQSFKVPSSTFALTVKVRCLIANYSNCGIRFRTSPTGADITPDWLSVPELMTVGQDYYLSTGLKTGGHGIVAGQTIYAVWQTTEYHASSHAWHRNSLTDAYADGGASYWNGSAWVASNYDYWFKLYTIEQQARCSIVVSERQPVEQVATQILQTCHGRLTWWDGLYRVTLDSLASGSLLLSDLQSPVPDIPILEGSLVVQRSDSEVPNELIGSYFDTEKWQRLPVKVDSLAVQQGTEQPRVLDASFVAVPSGGQLYRLLNTWLARASRTWRAQCDVPQHGLRLAPGDTVRLTSRLFSVTKACLVDDISDGPGGTFRLSLVEYSSADFSTAAYLPQAEISTTTVYP